MRIALILWVFGVGMVTSGLIDKAIAFGGFGYWIGFWLMIGSCIWFWIDYVIDL